MKILILGASGMLGSTVMRVLSKESNLQIIGTVRSESTKRLLPLELSQYLITGVDVGQIDTLLEVFDQTKPQIVINCIGLVKQLVEAEDPLQVIPINSILPHRLLRLCEIAKSRLIHISTDCVFSGHKGLYTENDISDAQDLYGRSKYLGEVNASNAITLRTSIIGHELGGSHGLIEWFLSQNAEVLGFRKAIFSGLPTVELAHLIRDYIIPNPLLHGLYNVSSDPISKFDLLSIVARVYQKKIMIKPDDVLVINRSLDSTKFRDATGYQPPSWLDLINKMHEFN